MSGPFRCTAPVARFLGGLWVYRRCRRCERCMEMRRYHWQCRTVWETMHSEQTCFVTLTFGRAARGTIYAEAAAADHAKSSAKRLFAAAGAMVSKYIRDLRELDARYLFVPEPHVNGFPHFHALVHVNAGVKLAQIQAPWDRGFGCWKWVRDRGAITYVTKYLAKGRYGRVRASLKYGGPDRFGKGTHSDGEAERAISLPFYESLNVLPCKLP